MEISSNVSHTSIMHCEFHDNQVLGDDYDVNRSGGAVSANSSLMVYRSFFVSNHADYGHVSTLCDGN